MCFLGNRSRPVIFKANYRFNPLPRGRLDVSRKEAAPADTIRELLLAMKQVAEMSQGPAQQSQSMGCSIKWKQD
jgi:hypothetical protein